ncbi:MAG TPA: hypothetical protein VIK26_00680 [Clostridium sp.]
MKKSSVLFAILLCLSFNIMRLTPVAAANVFKEGFYKVSDFNFSSNNTYNIQNISSGNDMYVLIFDNQQNLEQSIRLEPTSIKYKLVVLKPEDRIIIVGKGEVFIS